MIPNPSTDARSELLHDEIETFGEMVAEYNSGRYALAPWRVVPAARLTRIWESAAELGFVRDEKGLDQICGRMIENYMRLSVNTTIAGHANSNMDEELSECFDTEEEREAFVHWAIDTDKGWRISDYGLDKLFIICAALKEATEPMEKLLLVDMALNITHQRSDLASWFVEGGTWTLSRIAEGARPSEAQTISALNHSS